MGLLKYTKDYSASDDGNSLTGAEIGTLQTDISAILNGGISNTNIASDAAIVESKLSFNTTSGHNHDGSNSRTLSAGGQRGYIQGAELEWVATDQVKAQSGVIEIAGTFYTRTSYSTTLDLDTATHWVEGSSQRGTSKWVYVYAYNDSGSTWDIKYWLQPPQYANTGTDDSSVKIFRSNASVWYRCIGAVRLNATGSGEINEFTQTGNCYVWQCADTTVSTSTGDIACSALIPPVIADLGFFIIGVNSLARGVVSYGLYRKGSSKTDYQLRHYCETNGDTHQSTTWCQTDGSADQYVNVRVANSGGVQLLSLQKFILKIR